MMKYVMLLIVATLAAAVFALADVVGKVDNTAHAQAGTPSNVSATNGANTGEAMVSWDAVAGASEYRVGWLAVADYEANIDNDRWRERFAYSDVNASSSYTVTRLTPGDSVLLHHGPETGRRHSVVGVGDADAQWRHAALLQSAGRRAEHNVRPAGGKRLQSSVRWLSPGASWPERPATASAG